MHGPVPHRRTPRTAIALFVALAAPLLLCGCGREPPPSEPPADIHLHADGGVTCHGPSAPTSRVQLRIEDMQARDRARRAVRDLLEPWIRAQGRNAEPDGSSKAELRIRIHPNARWAHVQLLAAIAAHPELRVWRFTLALDGEPSATPFETPRDPGLTDAGPLVGELMLPVEYRAVCLSVERVTDAQGHDRTRLVLDERAWMEAPKAPETFDLPTDGTAGPEFSRVLERAGARLRARVREAKPDCVAFFTPWPADPALTTGEVLAIYRALRRFAPLPILLGDPSNG